MMYDNDDVLLQESSGYRFLDYFFLGFEFVSGFATVEEKLVAKAIGTGNRSAVHAVKYWEPVCTLISVYSADSLFGKLWVLAAAAGGIGITHTVILILAVRDSLANSTGDVLNLVITFLTDVHRPIRWALMYSSKPNQPFKPMRRFIVLTEAAYLFGKFGMQLITFIPGVTTYNHLDVVLPVALIVKYALYTVLLILIYKRQGLPTYFERFAVDKSMRDTACFIAKKVGRKSQAIQSKLENRPRNKALSIGILVTLAVFLPFTMARFDNEMAKTFMKNHKDVLAGAGLKIAMGTAAPFISVISLIMIEFVLTPILNRFGRQPYYISWLTFCYVVILLSSVLVACTYLQLEADMQFPKLPPGKAHLTLFNCLPASLEIEWPDKGEVDRVRNLDYTRKILLDVPQQAEWKVFLNNKPAGKYGRANTTVTGGRENIYVTNYDGMTRANMTESLSFDRNRNTKAQLRILDCFEVCCHGSVTVTPKVLEKKHRKKQKSVTVVLTPNLLSERVDVYEGTYEVSYQPDASTSLRLGSLKVRRTDKAVLALNSIQHPSFKFVIMVGTPTVKSGAYVSLVILDGVFRISHAYQKMIVVYLTDRKIFSFMLGIHFMLTRIADFVSTSVSRNDNFNHSHAFIILGLSGLCFVVYLSVVTRLRRRFNPTIAENAPKADHRRPRAASNVTAASNITTESAELIKEKAQ